MLWFNNARPVIYEWQNVFSFYREHKLKLLCAWKIVTVIAPHYMPSPTLSEVCPATHKLIQLQ